jgi:hypothetical protein
MAFEPTISSGFAEGGRTDGVRLEAAFRETYHGTNRPALHQILTKFAAALTAASEDPATMTVNEAVTFLETAANLDDVIAEY